MLMPQYRATQDGRLSRFVAGVHKSLKRSVFAANYLKSVRQWISARGYGFYEVDSETGMAEATRATGVSHRFLDRYEEVRDGDPLLHHVRARRRPCLINFAEDSRLVTSEFLETFYDEKLGSYMLGPVIVGKEVMGTLNFARARGDPPFTARDLRRLQIACVHVSRAYAQCLQFEQVDRERERYRQVLDVAPYAVYVAAHHPDAHGRILYRNRRAMQLEVLESSSIQSFAEPGARVNYQAGGNGHGHTASIRSVKIDPGQDIWVHFLADQAQVRLSDEAQFFLTRREKELIDCLIRGLDNQTIADSLCISPHTVKQHFRNLFEKFSVHSRAELLARVLAPSHSLNAPRE